MSNELILFFALFARNAGFFLLSPLFTKRNIPVWVRLGVAFSCSLILLPPLTSELILKSEDPLLFATRMIQEIAVGYLLGFLFSLLFEAAAFAGQVVGTLTGFSATELLDPFYNSEHPLISRLFTLILFALFFALDLHHICLRLLYESYKAFPPNAALENIFGIIEAFGRLFTYALSYAFFPMVMLLPLILCFAILARFLPFLQMFWTGFPLQLLIGFGAIALAAGFFGQILQGAFNEFLSIARKVLFPL
ncbi:MAG: flagellar biosynthetic protein FliR [Chlamydiales bacterium]|nr:flagellar biosynthetic protein FliR [Chlamydiales bacterium]